MAPHSVSLELPHCGSTFYETKSLACHKGVGGCVLQNEDEDLVAQSRLLSHDAELERHLVGTVHLPRELTVACNYRAERFLAPGLDF